MPRGAPKRPASWVRAVFACAPLGLAALLASQDHVPLHVWVAACLVADVLVFFLPWRLPRRGWSGWSFWFESLLYLAAPAAILVAAVHTRQHWLGLPANEAWFVLAVGIAGGLVLLSGIDLRLLLSGDLAALAGPDRPSHGAARATHELVAAPLEEVVFRGATLPLGAVQPANAVLSLLAFVARHRLVKGFERLTTRALVVESIAGLSFLGLAIGSGSVWCAALAHALANLPVATLELQRSLQ
jgi:hypothetical protein